MHLELYFLCHRNFTKYLGALFNRFIKSHFLQEYMSTPGLLFSIFESLVDYFDQTDGLKNYSLLSTAL